MTNLQLAKRVLSQYADEHCLGNTGDAKIDLKIKLWEQKRPIKTDALIGLYLEDLNKKFTPRIFEFTKLAPGKRRCATCLHLHILSEPFWEPFSIGKVQERIICLMKTARINWLGTKDEVIKYVKKHIRSFKKICFLDAPWVNLTNEVLLYGYQNTSWSARIDGSNIWQQKNCRCYKPLGDELQNRMSFLKTLTSGS